MEEASMINVSGNSSADVLFKTPGADAKQVTTLHSPPGHGTPHEEVTKQTQHHNRGREDPTDNIEIAEQSSKAAARQLVGKALNFQVLEKDSAMFNQQNVDTNIGGMDRVEQLKTVLTQYPKRPLKMVVGSSKMAEVYTLIAQRYSSCREAALKLFALSSDTDYWKPIVVQADAILVISVDPPIRHTVESPTLLSEIMVVKTVVHPQGHLVNSILRCYTPTVDCALLKTNDMVLDQETNSAPLLTATTTHSNAILGWFYGDAESRLVNYTTNWSKVGGDDERWSFPRWSLFLKVCLLCPVGYLGYEPDKVVMNVEFVHVKVGDTNNNNSTQGAESSSGANMLPPSNEADATTSRAAATSNRGDLVSYWMKLSWPDALKEHHKLGRLVIGCWLNNWKGFVPHKGMKVSFSRFFYYTVHDKNKKEQEPTTSAASSSSSASSSVAMENLKSYSITVVQPLDAVTEVFF